jgi:hypothetical protein
MTDDGLTPGESAILLLLMAEAREISNTELEERYKFTLTGKSRKKLNDLRYVATRKVGRAYVHQLDDKGWVRVRDGLAVESPRARALGAALSALHDNLRGRVLPRTGCHNLGELFSRGDDDVHVPPAAEGDDRAPLEERIRKAYVSLAHEPGGWVSLARLRPLFADVDRGVLDEALRRLNREADVNIVPESNQKTLTAEQAEAAVDIGGRAKHLLAIGV